MKLESLQVPTNQVLHHNFLNPQFDNSNQKRKRKSFYCAFETHVEHIYK